MDFPGKNTGVGCHYLLQEIFPIQGSNQHLLHWQVGSLPLSHHGSPYICMKKCEGVSLSVVSNSLKLHGLQLTSLFCPWNSPCKNTGVGSHSLLQGIFLIQGSNLRFLHCKQILYRLSHQGSPIYMHIHIPCV